MRTDLQNVQVPLNDFVREIAREAAREVVGKVISQHAKGCATTAALPKLEARLSKMEEVTSRVKGRLMLWIGIMLGSGLAGGLSGLGVAKIFGG